MELIIRLKSQLLREALHELLKNASPGWEPVTSPDSCEGCDFHPDLVIVDLPSLTEEIYSQWPEAKVVLLDTGLEENQILGTLLSYKLSGIISTCTNLELFRKAVEVIHAGQVWIDNGKIKALIQNHESIVSMKTLQSISNKERQIIELISKGLKNKDIADLLAISEQTVKAHLNRIFRKVKVSNRSQLIPLAMKMKFSRMT
jgi:DNA-binding NarL/FixJ family response regulator